MDIQAVEGKRVELPCNVTPPGHDKLYMVLWFKADAGIPLYRSLRSSHGTLQVHSPVLLKLSSIYLERMLSNWGARPPRGREDVSGGVRQAEH
ncbi:hypothetical protein J6590_047150 [Homalodisca vitripennis]|nr:hypothetical protein J6590_047150 [Homalodisca vitripennis]